MSGLSSAPGEMCRRDELVGAGTRARPLRAAVAVCSLMVLVLATGQSAYADVFFDQVGVDIDGDREQDMLGTSVAMSADGGRVAISATGDWRRGHPGYVRILDWDGVEWSRVGGDIEADVAPIVAMTDDGSRVALGRLSVRIFDWDGAAWVQVGAEIGGLTADSLAFSTDGDRLAIGTRSGQVRVFDRDGAGWVPVGADIEPEDIDDGSVASLAMSADGDRVAIGSPWHRSSGPTAAGGLVRVFDWNGAQWLQTGDGLTRAVAHQAFGGSVAMSDAGDRLAIGGHGNDDLGPEGGVWVYDFIAGNWVVVDETIDTPVNAVALSADGRRLAFSASTFWDGAVGRTTIRNEVSSGWVDDGTIDGVGYDDLESAIALSADGGRVAIGSQNAYGTDPFSGHVRVFDLTADPPPAPTGPASVVPARLLETREGELTVDGVSQGVGRAAAGSVTEVVVARRGGVPSGAASVLLNVGAVQADGAGFLTVYPCGAERPLASNVNYEAGQTIANSVFVSVGDGGKVCVFTHAATDLIVDVTGHSLPRPALRSGVPARLLDTRTGEVEVGYEEWEEIGRAAAGSVTELVVNGRGGVPLRVSSVALNVGAVLAEGPGFLTVYPCGTERPLASSVNYSAGQTIANSVFVSAGVRGRVCIYTHAATDLIVDVTGSASTPDGLIPVAPARLLETREGEVTVDGVSQGVGRAAAGSVTEVVVAGRGGVPSAASSVWLNVGAVQAEGAGFLTVYPCGAERPVASNVNYEAGQTIANSVFVSVGDGGKVCVFTHAATDLIVDVTAHT